MKDHLHLHRDTEIPMEALCDLWNTFADIAVNDDGEILESFHTFNPGTNREEVWHWFEARNPDFVAGLAGQRIGQDHPFRDASRN